MAVAGCGTYGECKLAQSTAPRLVAATLYFAGRRRAAGSLAQTPAVIRPRVRMHSRRAQSKQNGARCLPHRCAARYPRQLMARIPAGTVSHVVAMDAHVLNESVRWIRLQQSTEWYSLDSTTGELQVVRDLPLFVPLATIRTVFFGKAFFKIRAQPLTAHDASLCHKY